MHVPGVPLRALEFYSGIGGMHYALRSVLPDAQVMAAFDINDVANAVYAHNFGLQPQQANLQKVSANVLDSFKAQLWMLAPPCQPYTRRGLRQDADDRRAGSFMRLIELLPILQHAPEYLLVENVVGFEASRTRSQLWGALSRFGYDMQEFILSPLQLRVPYSRPRYFALARKRPANGQPSFPAFVPAVAESKPLLCDPLDLLRTSSGGPLPQQQLPESISMQSSAVPADNVAVDQRPNAAQGTVAGSGRTPDTSAAHIQPLARFLATDPEAEGVRLIGGQEELMQDNAGGRLGTVPPEEYKRAGPRSQAVAKAKAEGHGHWGEVFDIVTADSRRCNCFTKTYSRYSKGSGSVIATRNLHTIKM
ncbi:hypothetical protein WJX72_012065 [[Myrmecia] bisecta]|uniref:S-adenosyl-L-methionine-dependent methyltransferase n=1 Tax=[Myrmecia] bisecta TaxID=41462 RepID=A0AAW1PUQ3_9CHLO